MDDHTCYVQDAQRRLNRMSEGSATAADYIHYAQAYRALKRRGYRIPEEWPQPLTASPALEENP
jgi:hypothetical protein